MTNLIPFTLESRSSGFEKDGSSISDILAVRSARSDAQPLCSPTACGNSAHGNSRTFEHVVHELDQLVGALPDLDAYSAVCAMAVRFSRTWCVQLPDGVTM